MSASRTTLVFFLLLTSACTRPLPSDDSGGEADTEESTTSSTSMTGDGDTTVGDTLDTGGGFLPTEPDVPDRVSCDPFARDCPEGEKCVPFSSTGDQSFDAHKCVPVLGAVPTGSPCTYAGTAESTDDCDATGFCWNVHEVDGELVGTCHAFCMGTPDTPECPEGTFCPVSGSGSIGICLDACDPIEQDCDDQGTACYWDSGGGFICIPTLTDLPPGAPCGFINDCTAGLCVTVEVLPMCDGASCCAPWCDVDLGDGQCAAVPGTACVAFFEQGTAPPGYDHVGVCILPS